MLGPDYFLKRVYRFSFTVLEAGGTQSIYIYIHRH